MPATVFYAAISCAFIMVMLNIWELSYTGDNFCRFSVDAVL